MNSTSRLRSALLALLTISFITVFSTGCGNSREDFVATGGTNTSPNGNLVFRFQQATAQAVDTVPAGTVRVRIDLFSSDVQNASTFVVGAPFAFSETIVFENVPPSVVSSLVTTFNADGLPTGFLVGSVDVVPGQSTEVDLNDVQPVPFEEIAVTPDPAVLVVDVTDSDGAATQQLTITGQFAAGFQNQTNAQTTGFDLPINANSTEFVLGNSTLANISADGILSAEFRNLEQAGNTTLTTTYNFLGTEQTDTSDVLVYIFGALATQTPEVPVGGTYDGSPSPIPFGFIFVSSNGTTGANGGSISFALENAVTGVTVDASTGVVTADNSAVAGTNFNVVVTFVDDGPTGSGRTFTDTVAVSVVDPE